MASSDKHPDVETRAQGEESDLSLKVPMKSPELSVPLTELFSKWGKGVVDKMTPEAARDHLHFIRQDEGFKSDAGDQVLGSNADKLTRALEM